MKDILKQLVYLAAPTIALSFSSLTAAAVLLQEDWEDGDLLGWTTHGTPPGGLYSGPNSLGQFSFDNNGDENHTSGAIWNTPILIESGLYISASSYSAAGNCDFRPFCINSINFSSSNNLFSTQLFGVNHSGGRSRNGTQPDFRFMGSDVVLAGIENAWVELAMYTRPDGSVGYYVNNELAAETDAGYLTYNGSYGYFTIEGRAWRSTNMLTDSIFIQNNVSQVPIIPSFFLYACALGGFSFIKRLAP